MRALRWIVDLLVVGGIVGALFAGDASVLLAVAVAFAIIAAALTSGIQRITSANAVRWLLVGILALTALHAAHGVACELRSDPRAIFFFTIWLVMCALTITSTVAAARGHLPLAGGLALGALSILNPMLIPIGVGVLASALMIADMREWSSARAALTTSCAALLASRCATGLAYELACARAPSDWGLDHWSHGMEPAGWIAMKTALEIATIVSSLAVLRGRTAGVLALAVVGPTLAWIAHRSHAPYWSSGCLGHAHPFSELGGVIAVPALVIVFAWAAPMIRALRRT